MCKNLVTIFPVFNRKTNTRFKRGPQVTLETKLCLKARKKKNWLHR